MVYILLDHIHLKIVYFEIYIESNWNIYHPCAIQIMTIISTNIRRTQYSSIFIKPVLAHVNYKVEILGWIITDKIFPYLHIWNRYKSYFPKSWLENLFSLHFHLYWIQQTFDSLVLRFQYLSFFLSCWLASYHCYYHLHKWKDNPCPVQAILKTKESSVFVLTNKVELITKLLHQID